MFLSSLVGKCTAFSKMAELLFLSHSILTQFAVFLWVHTRVIKLLYSVRQCIWFLQSATVYTIKDRCSTDNDVILRLDAIEEVLNRIVFMHLVEYWAFHMVELKQKKRQPHFSVVKLQFPTRVLYLICNSRVFQNGCIGGRCRQKFICFYRFPSVLLNVAGT